MTALAALGAGLLHHLVVAAHHLHIGPAQQPPYARFEELPDGWQAVDYLDCAGPCRRHHTPHEIDGPLARCCTCGTHRAVSRPRSGGPRA